MYKPEKSISVEILDFLDWFSDFLDWFSSDEPNEYEKGIMIGLRIAQTIAEIVERNNEVNT
jgi:hypothetical protein